MGIFWSESVGLADLMLPLLLMAFVSFCLFQSLHAKGHQGGVSRIHGVRGWTSVCRELPFLALLLAPTSEG